MITDDEFQSIRRIWLGQLPIVAAIFAVTSGEKDAIGAGVADAMDLLDEMVLFTERELSKVKGKSKENGG